MKCEGFPHFTISYGSATSHTFTIDLSSIFFAKQNKLTKLATTPLQTDPIKSVHGLAFIKFWWMNIWVDLSLVQLEHLGGVSTMSIMWINSINCSSSLSQHNHSRQTKDFKCKTRLIKWASLASITYRMAPAYPVKENKSQPKPKRLHKVKTGRHSAHNTMHTH